MPSADIGLIGLAVMGSNLALNIAEKGYTIAVHNRTASKIDDFMVVAKEQGLDGKIVPEADIKAFIQSVKRPRSIIIMVKAGQPVDDMIEQLLPMLEKGDAILECGNSLYTDTQRRFDYLAPKGIGYLGIGVSGGEEGARHGPSIMVGGAEAQWKNAQPILDGDLGQVQRRTLLRLSGRGRRRSFRQDHPQRHRIWRHADDRRSLWRDARRAGHEPQGLVRSVQGTGTRARSTPTSSRSPATCSSADRAQDRQAAGRTDPRQGRPEGHRPSGRPSPASNSACRPPRSKAPSPPARSRRARMSASPPRRLYGKRGRPGKAQTSTSAISRRRCSPARSCPTPRASR